jgi:CRISPR/Cas system-associated endonuclease Cas1
MAGVIATLYLHIRQLHKASKIESKEQMTALMNVINNSNEKTGAAVSAMNRAISSYEQSVVKFDIHMGNHSKSLDAFNDLLSDIRLNIARIEAKKK